ncbi:MAG: glutamate synthase subunit beta [Deltaproteobacteria bacterium]|nr:glutamate synthase subunit beta [Deltaproteobacteria bacterium]
MSRDPRAFLQTPRRDPPTRPPQERARDWGEVEQPLPTSELIAQARRCMGCGVPFCHQGCPLGNEIPAWNELVGSAADPTHEAARWQRAAERLHATNNFPEITGKICPAPCERACVLDLSEQAVTIRGIESAIASRAFAEGWVTPKPAARATGKRVAVIGSGPAGLAAAQQLVRVGHAVTVFDKAPRAGGLLRYGIPDFKLDRKRLDLRLQQLRAEGVEFALGQAVGTDVTPAQLRSDFDAILLAIGAEKPRPLGVPGDDLPGVVAAMDYLCDANRVVAGEQDAPRIDAAGRHVVILGGGDTGADCLGTALRQGAASVHHFHYKPAPAGTREETPWPWAPMTLHSTSHDEGGERGWSLLARQVLGEGRAELLRCERVDWERADGQSGEGGRMRMRPRGEFEEFAADLVLVATGFVGVRGASWLDALGVERDAGGRVRTAGRYATTADGVWVAGDARRGASLVVHAIAEGRGAARAIDVALMGQSALPDVAGDDSFGALPG